MADIKNIVIGAAVRIDSTGIVLELRRLPKYRNVECGDGTFLVSLADDIADIVAVNDKVSMDGKILLARAGQ